MSCLFQRKVLGAVIQLKVYCNSGSERWDESMRHFLGYMKSIHWSTLWKYIHEKTNYYDGKMQSSPWKRPWRPRGEVELQIYSHQMVIGGWRVDGQSHGPVALSPGNAPSTLCTRGWVGRTDGQDGWGKPRPPRDLIPIISSPQRIATPTALSWPTVALCGPLE